MDMKSALSGLATGDKGKSPKKAVKHLPKKAHPGFKAVQASIAKKEGVSKDAAGAILANSSRHASAGAKKANPALKKVK
jgi:hypothetical protein